MAVYQNVILIQFYLAKVLFLNNNLFLLKLILIIPVVLINFMRPDPRARFLNFLGLENCFTFAFKIKVSIILK